MRDITVVSQRQFGRLLAQWIINQTLVLLAQLDLDFIQFLSTLASLTKAACESGQFI